MSQYVIRGGREGKERLKLIFEIMLPTTIRLLKDVGIREGMRCLDIGCGGGHVTTLLSEMVGPNGKVVGTDFDREILSLAQQDADAAKISNIEYRCADATDHQESGFYDVVYGRYILTHLVEPQKCLSAMMSACKPNGRIVIEDIDFTGNFCYPPCKAYERYTDLYQKVVQLKGADANIGPKLPGMLRETGAKGIQFNIVQPAHMEGDAKYASSITMEKISSAVISAGLATQKEVEAIIDELNEFAENPHAIIGVPRMFQVWGTR